MAERTHLGIGREQVRHLDRGHARSECSTHAGG